MPLSMPSSAMKKAFDHLFEKFYRIFSCVSQFRLIKRSAYMYMAISERWCIFQRVVSCYPVICLYPFTLSAMSQTVIRDALCEQEEPWYLLAPLPPDRRPQSLVSPAETSRLWVYYKSHIYVALYPVGQFHLTCDLSATTRGTGQWCSLRVFFTTCQMVAIINESTPHNIFPEYLFFSILLLAKQEALSNSVFKHFLSKKKIYLQKTL